MNRFRPKKKARDDGEGEMHALASFPGFRKGKKAQIESKSEINLATALPSVDDFRTSLLMPNLSARFSMLREQDDPSTKIGKANDDSVLFPRRASRLNLFAHNPLTDIAEVSSISGSTRPSLNLGRTSYGSAEASPSEEDHTGSVLHRPRPVEGNTLFGGRQKVFKIPAKEASTSDVLQPGEERHNMRGKALYENDMPLSTFQKSRDIERQDREERNDLREITQQIEEEILSTLPGDQNARDFDRRPSEQNSASSTPIKQSFPGLERSATKSRRLYEQGLEIQNQHSTLDRIETLSRRTKAAEPSQMTRSLSKSAVSLNEKYYKPGPVYASSNFRPNSPPNSASSVSGSELSKKISHSNSVSSNHGYAMAPLSPPLSESGEISPLLAALQPEDRGKATATGLFNKPNTKYDEGQFQQHQVQMYEGRTTSPFRRPSPSAGLNDAEIAGRPRGLSTTSYRSRAESAASAHSGSQDGRLPRRTNGGFLVGFNESDPGSDLEGEAMPNARPVTSAPKNDNGQTSLRSSTDSGDSFLYNQPAKSPYLVQSELKRSESRDLKTINEIETVDSLSPVMEPREEKAAKDSPTLGPVDSGGLSGLVRMHLRHDSEKSSIFPPPSPGLPPSTFDHTHVTNHSLQATRASSHSASIHSNPWELDDWSKPSQSSERANYSPPRPPPQAEQYQQPLQSPPPAPASTPTFQQPGYSMMSLRARQMLEQANALSGQAHGSGQPSRDEYKQPIRSPNGTWQEDLHHGHRRGGSSETQFEREELAHELAERRRKVQEKLKSIADTESSGSTSPTSVALRDRDLAPVKPGNAFAMLKNKATRNDNLHDLLHPKPLKVLGMENAAHNASAPNLASNNDLWREEEDRMLRDFGRQPRTASPHITARHGGPRQQMSQSAPRASHEETQDTYRDGPSPSWRRPHAVRDRSTSDASGRSKSRPRHRDDLENFGRGLDSPQHRPGIEDGKSLRGTPSGPSSTRPSIDNERLPSERSGSSIGGRFRSNSRPAPPNFPPVQTGPALTIGTSPRPSPVTPYSANATPPLFETSPAGSSVTTPTLGSNSASSQSAQWQQSLGAHKRYVDKSQISEPKFLSSTSNVPTVGLPPGASLSNGSSTPPLPPMNPRRRRPTATQTILGAFKTSEKSDVPAMPSPPITAVEEQSTFSDDDKRSKPRQRLRKISSEGGNLNAKARQQVMMAKSPAVPQVPSTVGTPVRMDGGMF